MKKEILKECRIISGLIAEKIEASEIYLFGSHAYGVPNEDSDIDIYLIADTKNRKKLEIAQIARRSLIGKIKAPVDIIVNDIETFEARKKIKTTLEYIIANEGVKLYERAN